MLLLFCHELLFFRFRDAYLTSTKQVLSNLVGYSKPSNMAYLGFKTNLQQASLSSSMDHLSCFYPGMLVLGVMHGLNSSVIEIAEKLVHTCYSMYNSTLPTHLAPEVSNFNTQTTSTSDIVTASVSFLFLLFYYRSSCLVCPHHTHRPDKCTDIYLYITGVSAIVFNIHSDIGLFCN